MRRRLCQTSTSKQPAVAVARLTASLRRDDVAFIVQVISVLQFTALDLKDNFARKTFWAPVEMDFTL
jgi:hypothetical protein